MKITVERSNLVNATGNAMRAINNRNSLPILSYYLIEADKGSILITGTDLDTVIQSEAEAEVEISGSVAVPATLFNDMISRLPEGPISLTENGSKVFIKQGKNKYEVPCTPSDDYPQIPQLEVGTKFTVSQSTLKDMLRYTTGAASKEESRSLLMGVLFEIDKQDFSLVATDTHRLAWKKTTLTTPNTSSMMVIVPAKPLVDFERLIKDCPEEININISDSRIEFDTAGVKLICRVLDGTYPNYKKVIPASSSRKIKCKRTDLQDALKVVEVVARTASQKMIFESKDSKLYLRSESPEAGKADADVDVNIEGESILMAFNCGYLSEAVNTVKGDSININLNGPLNPGTLSVEGDDSFLYVIMPMQA